MTLCVNVKDKRNKSLITKCLKTLQTWFKLNTIPTNGLACFVGIDVDDDQFVEIFEPQVKVVRFIYKCGPKFDSDVIAVAYATAKANKYLVTITGDASKIYSYSTDFTLLTTINGLLIKRHNKGGQSSVRFSRLADESRSVYATKIIDKINSTCSGHVYVCGSSEIRNLVTTSDKLVVKITTIPEYIVVGPNFVNENKKRLVEILESRESENDQKIEQVCNLIQQNPDMLTFGIDIDLDECEYIVTIDETLNDAKYVFIPNNSKYYVKIHDYVSIGKKYY